GAGRRGAACCRGHTRSCAESVGTAQLRRDGGVRRTVCLRIPTDGIANPEVFPGGTFPSGSWPWMISRTFSSMADWIRPFPSDMVMYKRPVKSAPTAMMITYSLVGEPLRAQPRLRRRRFQALKNHFMEN